MTEGPSNNQRPGPAYFLARIGAHVLDLIVCFGLFYVIGMAVAARFGGLGARGQFNVEGLPALIILGAVSVASLAYFTILEGSAGRTLGKMIFGLKVIGEDGQRAGFGAAILRNLLRFVDAFFFYVLGLVFLLTTEKQQRIGDKAAGTLVVRSRSAGLQVAGVVLILAFVSGSIVGGLRIQTVALQNAKMEIQNIRLLEGEGGPATTKTYAPGDDLYLIFDLRSVSINDQGMTEASVRFEAFDPSGKPILEAVTLPVTVSRAEASGEGVPVNFHLTFPQYALGGEHTIQITAEDPPRKAQISRKLPVTVVGPQSAANAALGLQDHAFTAVEDGPPLSEAVYASGSKVWSKFKAVGFLTTPEGSVRLRLDLSVLSETGERLLDQPDVIKVDQVFFYPPVYLPMTTFVETPSGTPAGRYRIQFVLHDDVAGTQATYENLFTIR